MNIISIYYRTVMRIRGKLYDFFLNSLSNNHDIIIFTESWLHDSVLDAEILNNNYPTCNRDWRAMNLSAVVKWSAFLIN